MGSRYDYLLKKYVENKKYGGIISKESLVEIIKADPTSIINENGEIIKVGKYTQWILRIYEETALVFDGGHWYSSKLFFEDLYKVREDLMIFHSIKNKKNAIALEKKDINQIISAEELYELIKSFPRDIVLTKSEQKVKIIHEDVQMLFDGDNWDVISPKTPDAAIAVSGPPVTRWCTAAEGRNYFDTYAKQGPLYIIRDKRKIIPSGRASGQPLPVWQLHFETSSFMDVDDKRIDIVKILSEVSNDVKEFFKHILKKYFLQAKMIDIKYPNDNASKFIALYGFEDFFNYLPEDTTDLAIDCLNLPIELKIPKSIGRFKQLETIFLQACITEIPEEIGELESLQNMSIPNNPKLVVLPETIAELPKLLSINIFGCPKIKIPPKIKMLGETNKIYIAY